MTRAQAKQKAVAAITKIVAAAKELAEAEAALIEQARSKQRQIAKEDQPNA